MGGRISVKTNSNKLKKKNILKHKITLKTKTNP